MNTVSAAAIYIALGIALNTIRNPCFNKGKEAAVAEKWLSVEVLDAESITLPMQLINLIRQR